MAFTIEGVDNEFAASTGNNVNTTLNSSTFDNPPQGSKDLMITTKDGDPSPREFEIGDTYEISWGGQGGGLITDAVVIRSDAAPDGAGGGIIVFEGLNESGEIAQIIWTPGFDLEGWYSDNYNPSAEPQFYTEDTQPEYTHRFVCFASEAQIATPTGPRPIGKLNIGDLVLTQDAGAAKILWAGQRICPAMGKAAPVVFEPGSIQNSRPLRLSQQHRVLVSSPLVQYYFGVDEVLVPAKALVNSRDIRILPGPRICYVHLLLEDHQLLQAEGAACESLFLGDQAVSALYGAPDFDNLQNGLGKTLCHPRTVRPVLRLKEAQLLMRAENRSELFHQYPLAV